MSDFTWAYLAGTDQQVRVPTRWMKHPKLSRGFRHTPSRKASDSKRAVEKQSTPAPAAGDNQEKE